MKEKKISGKTFLIFIGLFILLFQITKAGLQNIKASDWNKHLLPHTENFMKLFSEKKYEEIYKQYTINSGMGVDAFMTEIDKIKKTYGEINSYKYIKTTISNNTQKDKSIDLIVYYGLTLSNQKNAYMRFKVNIEDGGNESTIKLSFFLIESDFGENSFYIVLR